MSVCNSTALWGGLILYKFYDRVAKIVSKQPRKTKSSPLPFHKFSWIEKKLAFCQCQLVFICNFARAVQTAVQLKLKICCTVAVLLSVQSYQICQFLAKMAIKLLWLLQSYQGCWPKKVNCLPKVTFLYRTLQFEETLILYLFCPWQCEFNNSKVG